MADPNQYRLTVQVMISNEQFGAGGVSVRDEVVIRPLGFKQMAEILEAFHVLCEKYRVK